MRVGPVGILAVTACLVGASAPVRAEGAFAWGATGNIVEGFAYGYAHNRRTKDAAIAKALEECRDVNVETKARKNCKIVATYSRECVAVAFDPDVNSPGVGWAVGPTLEAAQDRAMASCKAAAGARREQFCKLDKSDCDRSSDSD